ncbi:MAG: glutamyl-tRNA reductase [Campylobacterota bacterium]|nr:glutamyl-tRNA reductase [Campylobacterota bacterium]
MHYLTISFTHKNSTLEIREKLAFIDDNALSAYLGKLHTHEMINEVFLVSTCNRIEIVLSCKDVNIATKHALAMLGEHSEISLEELERRADIFDDQGAIHHLFSVASSLDSMVVGETQIAGQLKDAYRFAIDQGYCHQKLERAVHYAFKCAAEVRNVTNISSGATSVASVAVAKAHEVVGSLEGKRALVIGAGDMSVISAKTLQRHEAEITIMNRTRVKAEEIALTCKARVRNYDELFHAINEYDLIFTSTGALEPIITEAMVGDCSFKRYWFDMAVPRDIDVKKRSDLQIFVVDDLKSIVDDNLSLREDEACAAFSIVGRHAMSFFDGLKSLSIEPLIKELYLRGFDAAKVESERVIAKNYIPKEYETSLQKACEQSVKRLLHDLSIQMRQSVHETKSASIISSLKTILNEPDEDNIIHKEP